MKFCLCQALSSGGGGGGGKDEAFFFLNPGVDGVRSSTLRPLYPGGKITQFSFSSRWGMLQSRSKHFRGALKVMPLLRIEPKFLDWVGIRTEIVYLTVAFRNLRNAHKRRQNVCGIYLSCNDEKIWV
jgi:hypothetical protein